VPPRELTTAALPRWNMVRGSAAQEADCISPLRDIPAQAPRPPLSRPVRGCQDAGLPCGSWWEGGENWALGPWVWVRLTHHAKNKMRWKGLSSDDVLAMFSPENRNGEDPRGNLFYDKEIRGVSFRAVLAADDLTTVITVYPLER
jgi:hypothetical protein